MLGENAEMRPFFTYFGGKFRIALKYPQPVSRTTIIEPFAGSAGFSVRNYYQDINLYDVDEKIVGVWEYLIKSRSSEISRLPLVVENVNYLKIPQEAKWLIGFWLNKGCTGPMITPGKWMRDGWRADSVWGIKHWTITHCSYQNIPDQRAYWFIDPPYHHSGKAYRYHDINYAELSQWCLSRRGLSIVCEQRGARWLPFKKFMVSEGSRGKNGGKLCSEVIYVQGTI